MTINHRDSHQENIPEQWVAPNYRLKAQSLPASEMQSECLDPQRIHRRYTAMRLWKE